MPMYGSFYPESVETIMEALLFILKKIDEYFDQKMNAVDETYKKLIEQQGLQERKVVENALEFMNEKATAYSMYVLSKADNFRLMSIIRSALEIYLKNTQKARVDTGLSVFDKKIQTIKRVMGLQGPKNGNPDLFDKYYTVVGDSSKIKGIEVFLSYSIEDKNLAGKIANLLGEKGIDVFLAHENIEISDEWRNEILKHLKKDDILIALLTDNYEKSVWTNQEAGYMMGKNGKNIHLIVGNCDVKKFGFLESFQGIPFSEKNINECIEKILGAIIKKKLAD